METEVKWADGESVLVETVIRWSNGEIYGFFMEEDEHRTIAPFPMFFRPG